MAPLLIAISLLPSELPLSATITSPVKEFSVRSFCDLEIQSSIVSDSFKQGITIERNRTFIL
jgi:hypothetical protein